MGFQKVLSKEELRELRTKEERKPSHVMMKYETPQMPASVKPSETEIFLLRLSDGGWVQRTFFSLIEAEVNADRMAEVSGKVVSVYRFEIGEHVQQVRGGH